MQILLLCLLAVGATAFPAMGNFTLTVDLLNKMISKINEHPECVPNYVLTAITTATDTEKAQFVDFMNKWNSGSMAKPHNMDEMMTLIKTEAPGIYQKSEQLMNEYKTRFAKLSPEAQAFMKKYEDESFKAMDSDDKMQVMKNMMQLGAQLLTDLKTLSPEIMSSIKAAFPEQVKAWEECPHLKAVQSMMDMHKTGEPGSEEKESKSH
ncbi:hypothetical protein Q1695_016228 [Nippostrongylus brasiliensis]|nr:hypothetical protein Q1695_016228 [Nippostrongylus brasiliensis]